MSVTLELDDQQCFDLRAVLQQACDCHGSATPSAPQLDAGVTRAQVHGLLDRLDAAERAEEEAELDRLRSVQLMRYLIAQGVPKQFARAFYNARCTSTEQIAHTPDAQLRALESVGPKAVREVRRVIPYAAEDDLG